MTDATDVTRTTPGRGLSRRRLLLGAGALGAAGVAGAAGAVAADAVASDGSGSQVRRRVDFHGRHQAGIATPVQGHLHFASYDVTTADRAQLVALLRDWTAAAREMTANRRVGGDAAEDRLGPPADTGEAVGLDAANLTLTVGFGRSLFDSRFGLADRRPAALADLPGFPGDTLDPALCGGDLAVQACADDPQVAVHAVRNLTRIAAGRAAVRWAQLGFGKASATDQAGPTPRNLFGFKDGTANVLGSDNEALDEQVWVRPGDGPDWMADGSYLVSRRIRMTVETWDRTSLAEQEQLVGRTKDVGAPLGSPHERSPVRPADLPATSHVRLAHPSQHGGARLLRRGFNFVDGSDGLGHLDAGLFFLAYQRDPRRQFVPIQQALARDDRMNEYLRHTGSAVWAVPPGVGADGWWGQTLLA
jgi:deferrochelatase/peroxidase EfeB